MVSPNDVRLHCQLRGDVVTWSRDFLTVARDASGVGQVAYLSVQEAHECVAT
jgi:hypothetical protein